MHGLPLKEEVFAAAREVSSPFYTPKRLTRREEIIVTTKVGCDMGALDDIGRVCERWEECRISELKPRGVRCPAHAAPTPRRSRLRSPKYISRRLSAVASGAHGFCRTGGQ